MTTMKIFQMNHFSSSKTMIETSLWVYIVIIIIKISDKKFIFF